MAKRRARPGIDDVPLPGDAINVNAVFPGDEPVRLKTLELTNQDDLNDLRALLDHAQEVLDQRDAPIDMTEISPNLISALQDLGDDYGAFGVARAAAGLTDIDMLVRNLGFAIDDEADLASQTDAALLKTLGDLLDELDDRGLDLNDHQEYTESCAYRKRQRSGTTSVTAPKYVSAHLEAIALKAASKAIADYFSEG